MGKREAFDTYGLEQVDREADACQCSRCTERASRQSIRGAISAPLQATFAVPQDQNPAIPEALARIEQAFAQKTS